MTTPAFQRISIETAQTLLHEKTCTLADIRDGQSFAMGHVPGAAHLDGNTVEMHREHTAFMDNAMRYQASTQFLDSKIRALRTAIKGE